MNLPYGPANSRVVDTEGLSILAHTHWLCLGPLLQSNRWERGPTEVYPAAGWGVKVCCVYTQLQRKKRIGNFVGKWRDLENSILNEGTQTLKYMNAIYSLISGY